MGEKRIDREISRNKTAASAPFSEIQTAGRNPHWRKTEFLGDKPFLLPLGPRPEQQNVEVKKQLLVDRNQFIQRTLGAIAAGARLPEVCVAISLKKTEMCLLGLANGFC